MKYKTITEEDSKEARLAKFFNAELQRRDDEALLEILSSESGRWFLMRMLDRTKMNVETFTGNSQTFYNEGMRKVGLLYMGDIARMGIGAIKLKQKAELEYVETQMQARQIACDYLDEEDNRDGR